MILVFDQAAIRPIYGRPIKLGPKIILAICVMWSATSAALELSARQLPQNGFEIVLKNGFSLSERDAQAYVASAALTLCKGLVPVPGKYHFESHEALVAGTLREDMAPFTFTQEVTCIASSNAREEPARLPTISSAEEEKRIRDDIEEKSEAYFHSLAASRFDEAYSQLLESAIDKDKATWTRDAQTFQLLAGEPLSISIVKITIYDNPADAPNPGLYVAADFLNSYKTVPYQCGYIMWYQPVGGGFGITRTEIGYVTAVQLKSIPEAQKSELKKRLKCIAP